VLAAPGAESVTEPQEVLFPDRVQHFHQCTPDDFVLQRRDPQRSLPWAGAKGNTSQHVSDHAGPTGHGQWRTPPCCLPLHRKRRHPGLIPLRGSIPGPSPPLSTLRPGPRGPARMTQGRCGSPYLNRTGLAPAASCRSPGAPMTQLFLGIAVLDVTAGPISRVLPDREMRRYLRCACGHPVTNYECLVTGRRFFLIHLVQPPQRDPPVPSPKVQMRRTP
jgi:hypothetical protein